MISILTCPKPFVGHIGIIQNNALRSWRALGDDVEIFLCGEEDGIPEAAEQFGAIHLHETERNSYGTPLLNSAFAEVAKRSSWDRICFVNTDIIVPKSILQVAQLVDDERTMVVGDRLNVDITEPIEFGDSATHECVDRLGSNAPLNGGYGSDYFLFHQGSGLAELPGFAVGRPGWDNWMLYRARQLGHRLINGTDFLKVIHQNHDYRHVPEGTGDQWQGPEADENHRIVEGTPMFHLLDCTHSLTPNCGVKKIRSLLHFLRHCETYPLLNPEHVKRAKLLCAIRNRLPSRLQFGGLEPDLYGSRIPVGHFKVTS